MDDDLTASLTGLSGMLTDHRPLSDTLTEIAHFAVNAIPGAEGSGLTMLEDGQAQTVVASEEFVRAVDDIQYALGEGPCVLAVSSGQTQVSGSLGGAQLWPHFGPRVGRLGVHSALSLPLVLPRSDGADQVIGALNVYAHRKDAFTPDAVQIGEWFARPAAVSVHNAQVLAHTRRLADQLQAALTHRAVIDQAIGVLMSRSGATPDEAFDRLRVMSQTQHVKISEVSRVIMSEAVRRARSRRATTDSQPDLG